MIFQFKSEDEIHLVIKKGLWMFEGRNIVFQPWHPYFILDKNKISKVLVWIRL